MPEHPLFSLHHLTLCEPLIPPLSSIPLSPHKPAATGEWSFASSGSSQIH